jgi:serine/threonine protein phosphatase PrpC
LLAAADSDEVAVRSLWAAAMSAGGKDNITIALVRRAAPDKESADRG